MDLTTANQILSTYEIPPVTSVRKSEVGFSNTIYELDKKYILKVCTSDKQNEVAFQLETQLYEHYRTMLPVPQLIAFDNLKNFIPHSFMLYERIEGDNLYNVWHILTNEQRRNVIKQLCSMLRTINLTNLQNLPATIILPAVSNWREHMEYQLAHYLQIAERMQTLSADIIANSKYFITQHMSSLEEQRLALVYWDVHFDNVLVKCDQIVGLLDFERTEIASIDFVLDTVKRMVDFPKKYMSVYAEQFAKDEDYQDLLQYYKEFYPELFAFERLGERLQLYSLLHDLKDLQFWPKVAELKQNIEKTSQLE